MNADEVSEAFARGEPVPVWIGDDELPVGDVGHARTDGRLLLTILAANARGAEMLRGAGIDEATVRTLYQ